MTTKTLLMALCLGAVLQAIPAMAQLPAQASPQATIIPAGMPKGGVKIQSDVVKILTSNTWTWRVSHAENRSWTMRFFPDGRIVHSDGWSGKYEIKDLKTVVIKVTSTKTISNGTMVFEPGYSSYRGDDINGMSFIEGEIVLPKRP